MVTVDYPWLPPKCAICNSWGHKSEDCAQAKTASILTKQQGTVIHNEISEKLAKSAAVSGESRQVAVVVQNLLSHLKKINALPAATEEANVVTDIMSMHDEVNDKEAEHDELAMDDGWSKVTSTGHSTSPKHTHVTPSNDRSMGNVGGTSSPSRFQILADISEDGGE
ncbi:predicted protein [Arabidopsis lyrata subsp. lyrata]|uniref:Predicted protein n=1 Tax=Arabidopsis lyrata subsp. lyrata TaxID=81972 RepID=D7MVT8_ARALL|nr:predicted protein [Arabidopsis lyrata subsp. lyrata]